MSARVVLLVVTSTGLRSTGGSLSQRLSSVHSFLRILSGVEATRYVVTVSLEVDRLADVRLLVVGAGVSAGTTSSGVDTVSSPWQVVLKALVSASVSMGMTL